MHSAWIRSNAVFFFGVAMLAVVASMCAWSTYFTPPGGQVNVLRLNQTKSMRMARMGGWGRPQFHQDMALLTFDLQADLRDAFNWNVKQLFLFVVAEYSTPSRPFNEVIVWDKVVPTRDDALIELAGETVKYPLTDQGTELRGADIKLRLYWDAMPLSGSINIKRSGFRKGTLPAQYTGN